MAEALGVASSLVTLVGLTLSVSQTSYEYIQKVRNAPESTSNYLREILALSSSLLKVQETLTLPEVASILSTDEDLLPDVLIAECQTEIQGIKRKLQKNIVPKSGSSSKFRSLFRSRFQMLTWPFEERETKQMIEKFARWNNIFTAVVSTCNLRIANETLVVIQDTKNDSQRMSVLNWIYSNPTAIDNNDVYKLHCSGTCSWLLETQEFLRWRDEDSKVLLCTGGPGVGKTTLASFAINHLRTSISNNSFVLYHYFAFKAERRYHAGSAVVRSLLKQLLENYDELPAEVAHLYENFIKTGSEPTENVWLQTFCDLITSSPKVYIILDGFDESPDRRGLSRIFEALKSSAAKTCVAGRPPIDIPVDTKGLERIEASAPESDMAIYIRHQMDEDEDFDSLLTETLRNEIVTILTNYANGCFLLTKFALKNVLGCTTVRQIRRALLELPKDLSAAYQSTFDRILFNTATKRDLALKTLSWILIARRPLNMTELAYALAFEAGDIRVDLENVATPKAIISACHGLIDHLEYDDSVLFSHATVQEYLENECWDHFESAELEVARTCLTYLSQPGFTTKPCQSTEEMIDRLDDYPLLGYAALQWGHHVIKHETDLIMEIGNFVQNRDLILNASQTFHFLRRSRDHVSTITFQELPQGFEKMHLLSLWGLKHTAALQLPTHEEIMAPDSLGWTPLHWAAARGHPEMMRFLLSHGADAESPDSRNWTPIFWAVFWSRLDAVRLLLRIGVSVTSQATDGDTPLHIAVSRSDPDICAALIHQGADWSIINNRGSSPRQDALDVGTPDVASVFKELMGIEKKRDKIESAPEMTKIERAARFAATDNKSFELLLEGESKAARRKDWPRPLLPRLEQQRAFLVARDPQELTCLGQCIGSTRNIKNLMNQDDYPTAVLAYSILTENLAMVKALIDFGVNLRKSWSGKYITLHDQQFPLLLAAYTGRADMLSLLIHAGADTEARDFYGRTPLHYAATLGHIEAVKVLSVHKTLVQARDKRGQSALHAVWAALHPAQRKRMTQPVELSSNLLLIAKLLVSNGANVNAMDKSGGTPLHEAVRTGNIEVVHNMIDLRADTNARAKKGWESRSLMEHELYAGTLDASVDRDGDTPFTFACGIHQFVIATALHKAGAILPETMSLREPLEESVANGDKSAVETLFSFGAASDVAGHDPNSMPLLIVAIRSLQFAMAKESQQEQDFRKPFIRPQKIVQVQDAPKLYLEVVTLLLEKGQNPNLADDQGNTPLLDALVYEYNWQIVDTLIQFGADAMVRNRDNVSTLHVAAATGYIPYIEKMLAYNVDLNQSSSTNETPISLAAANGNYEAVKLLLEQGALNESLKTEYDWLSMCQLYDAIESRDMATFSMSSSTKINIASNNRDGRTLLHLAALKGDEEAVSALISFGANVTSRDYRGNTPLLLAAASKASNSRVLHLLLDNGADIEARNYAGQTVGLWRIPQNATALHLSAYAGSQPLVQTVLERAISQLGDKAIEREQPERQSRARCFIDWTSDGCGRTALMCAVQSGDVPTARYLLENGAYVNADGGGGSWGFQALDIAKHIGGVGDTQEEKARTKTEMITLIESFGAEEFDW